MFVDWPYLIVGGVFALIGVITVLVLLAKAGALDAIGDFFD